MPGFVPVALAIIAVCFLGAACFRMAHAIEKDLQRIADMLYELVRLHRENGWK